MPTLKVKIKLRCSICDSHFISGRKDRKYCSKKCSKKNEEKGGNTEVELKKIGLDI